MLNPIRFLFILCKTLYLHPINDLYTMMRKTLFLFSGLLLCGAVAVFGQQTEYPFQNQNLLVVFTNFLRWEGEAFLQLLQTQVVSLHPFPGCVKAVISGVHLLMKLLDLVFRHRFFGRWTSWRSGAYHNRISGRRFP